MIKRFPSAIFMAMMCILSSCRFSTSVNNPSQQLHQQIRLNEAAPVSMTSYTRSDYKVFVASSDIPTAKLEPEEGCYVGSYVLANRRIGFDMRKFDSLTGKEHPLSVYNMRLGENFPSDWVLECAANMKTPYIIIRPVNDYAVFQEELILDTAREFGKISIPIFVDIYPNPQSYTRNAEKYVDFYRKASVAFREYAPSTALVISADSKSVYDFNLFYPGDEYVDWVGITLYQTLYVNGELNLRNHIKDLDYFYAMYQDSKPLVISQFAISSYSTADHRYASVESGKKLLDFYEMVKKDYCGIKAINYMDFSNVEGAPKNAERDNFTVTGDEIMLQAYKEAVNDAYFLSRINESPKTKIKNHRYYSSLYEDENFWYIPKGAFDTAGIDLSAIESVVINSEEYYSTERLVESGVVVVDDTKKHLTINKK